MPIIEIGFFLRIGKYKVLPARKPITSNVNQLPVLLDSCHGNML
ncbi:hypothetical protein SAMN04488098_10196 [Alkalibacterium thalassium]|uniref:Uncharacterized protein n=1 Tax=Alkalibacterium thalassium TaxID=426701 RepID=A0A1G9AB85_9LACT|nr:hypothetical protein SAMN04488098_10196 [Alkalibacterium thalassium]